MRPKRESKSKVIIKVERKRERERERERERNIKGLGNIRNSEKVKDISKGRRVIIGFL
jgi:hypothetical protein